MTKLDEFTRAYITAALWAETGSDDEPLDDNYTVHDINAETLARMVEDCRDFQAKYGELIQGMEAQAGHDFWLTRRGHGCGFWDGDWAELGDELTKAAESYGDMELDDYEGVVYAI